MSDFWIEVLTGAYVMLIGGAVAVRLGVRLRRQTPPWRTGSAWADLPTKISNAMPTLGWRTWRQRIGTLVVVTSTAALLWGDRVRYMRSPTIWLSSTRFGALLGVCATAATCLGIGYLLTNLLRNERRELVEERDGIGVLLHPRLAQLGVAHPDVVSPRIAAALGQFPDWRRNDWEFHEARKAVTFAVLVEENDVAKATVLADSLLRSLR
jgi:hypothetical protein